MFLPRIAAMWTLSCTFAADALAQPATSDAQNLALTALRMEFDRDEVSVPQAELDAAFAKACEAGYALACRRGTWVRPNGPSLDKVVEIFEPACAAGDVAACLVTGWALDGLAPTYPADDRDRAWRKAARYLKEDCDEGFQPACHDYAALLYANKGVVSEPAAAVRRWTIACDRRDAASCLTLARLHASGAPGVKIDRAAARKLADKACGLDYPAACAFSGQMQDKSWSGSMLDNFYGDLCNRGHADSCWRLARYYFEGAHPEPQPGRLDELFARGCALGHAHACFESGRYLLEHGGSPESASQRYSRGCDLGDAPACSAQVQLILTKQVSGTIREAQRAFTVACDDARSLEACKVLAGALIDGVDLPRDATRGRELLKRVCTDEKSDAEACFQLGRVYEDGLGGERDRTVASQYYRWSCNGGEVNACLRRGDLLVSDVGVRRDDAEALAMYRRACEGGNATACTKGGRILFEGTIVTQDLAGAAELYQKGCTGGDGYGCFGLGQSLERGAAGAPDPEGARQAYEAALTAGSLEAKRAMARLLWNGEGGRKNKGRAKALCREACQGGDPVACRGPAFLKS